MSRTIRLALLPALITLTIGLLVAASVAIGGSPGPKHPDLGSRFRLWGGFAVSIARYRAVVAGGVASAWAGSVLAIYSLLYIKPVWAAALVAVNVLVVGGIVYGVVVARPSGADN